MKKPNFDPMKLSPEEFGRYLADQMAEKYRRAIADFKAGIIKFPDDKELKDELRRYGLPERKPDNRW